MTQTKQKPEPQCLSSSVSVVSLCVCSQSSCECLSGMSRIGPEVGCQLVSACSADTCDPTAVCQTELDGRPRSDTMSFALSRIRARPRSKHETTTTGLEPGGPKLLPLCLKKHIQDQNYQCPHCHRSCSLDLEVETEPKPEPNVIYTMMISRKRFILYLEPFCAQSQKPSPPALAFLNQSFNTLPPPRRLSKVCV